MLPGRVIINADDFGWDRDSTQAILILASQQAITSTTVMANIVQTADLKSLQQYEYLSVGVHLNLIEGKPLADVNKIYSLVDPETGRFYSAFRLWKRALQGKVSAIHVHIEITTQINFLRDHGVAVSHADSHQHIHIFPGLNGYIQDSLCKNSIQKIRNCNIPEFLDKRRFIIKVFNLLARINRKECIQPDTLISAFSIYSSIDLELLKQKVLPVIKRMPVSEMMVHPALGDRGDSYLKRKEEFEFLLNGDWKKFLQKNGVKLITWKDI